MPEIHSKDPVKANGAQLVAVADLPPGGVVEVDTEQHGTLAVGLAGGEPFAVSNLCRHWGAKLGRGTVEDDCLQCPWHRARFDVRTGEMVRGPQGRVVGTKPYSKAIEAFGHIAKLRRFPVAVRDGVITLV